MDAGAPTRAARPGLGRVVARRCAWAALVLVEIVCLAWSALALALDAGAPPWLVALLLAGAIASLLFVRPRARGHGSFLLAFAGLLAWWLCIEPRNDRAWMTEVEKLPRMETESEQLTVHNLRNFEYRSDTDFTPRWETRRFDLAKLKGVDVYLSDWGAPGIVHTMLSWEFEGSEPLAISVETRKEQGESYSALRGFFRQYELYYVVADERDVVRVRTNVRGERVRLYRLNASPALARALLLGYGERINRLATQPAWYNALTHNCTTTIRLHISELGLARRPNWRLLANKYSDELLYMRGALGTALPFEVLRERSEITDEARAAGLAADFSSRIRRDLPPRSAPAR